MSGPHRERQSAAPEPTGNSAFPIPGRRTVVANSREFAERIRTKLPELNVVEVPSSDFPAGPGRIAGVLVEGGHITMLTDDPETAEIARAGGLNVQGVASLFLSDSAATPDTVNGNPK
jgi:hypothetical protein